MEYASKGVAGSGLGLGIAGTALGLLNGGLGNILGGGCVNAGCSENHTVNRYELGLEQANAAKDAEIALLKANTYGDQKLLEVYKYFDGELKEVRGELCNQRVHNQRTEDSFVLARQDIAAVRNDLMCRIEAEEKARCCGDNAIVTYANATFYPKMVADVTTGTTTTAQTLYNPLPRCGGNGCGC